MRISPAACPKRDMIDPDYAKGRETPVAGCRHALASETAGPRREIRYFALHAPRGGWLRGAWALENLVAHTSRVDGFLDDAALDPAEPRGIDSIWNDLAEETYQRIDYLVGGTRAEVDESGEYRVFELANADVTIGLHR